MVYDIDMLRNFYANFPRRVDTARERIGGRPMTLAEKILYAHLYDENSTRLFKRVFESRSFVTFLLILKKMVVSVLCK